MLELVAVLVPRQSERIDKVLVKERHAAEYRVSFDAVVAERIDRGQRPAIKSCRERHRAQFRVVVELGCNTHVLRRATFIRDDDRSRQWKPAPRGVEREVLLRAAVFEGADKAAHAVVHDHDAHAGRTEPARARRELEHVKGELRVDLCD